MKNSREKKLIKNTFIVALGQVCTKFISFFLLPLYTYLLTTEEFGIVDLLNTYVSLLIPLFFLQLDQASFRFLIDVRNNDNKIKKIISNVFFIILFEVLIYLIIFFIVSFFSFNKYKYFLLINVIASMLSGLILQMSRGLGDNYVYSKGSLIAGAGTIILNVFFIVVLKLGVIGLLLSTFIANILCFIYVFIKKKIYIYINIKYYDLKLIKDLLKYSIPLIPNAISWWIISASDRTIISLFLGVAFNGIYSSANKISGICITLYSIFNLAWTESASLHFKDNDNSLYFSKLFNNVLKIFSSLCIFMIVIIPFVFEYLIIGSDYLAAYYQIPILLVAMLFNIIVTFIGAIYISLKKSNEIAKTSIYSAIINILLHIILIKYIELYAASISTLIAYLLMSIYRLIDIQKYIKIKLNVKYIISFIIILIFVINMYYINNLLFNIISLLLSIIFIFYNNKYIINIVCNYFKLKLKNIRLN